jgi:hypothetical protein
VALGLAPLPPRFRESADARGTARRNSERTFSAKRPDSAQAAKRGGMGASNHDGWGAAVARRLGATTCDARRRP